MTDAIHRHAYMRNRFTRHRPLRHHNAMAAHRGLLQLPTCSVSASLLIMKRGVSRGSLVAVGVLVLLVWIGVTLLQQWSLYEHPNTLSYINSTSWLQGTAVLPHLNSQAVTTCRDNATTGWRCQVEFNPAAAIPRQLWQTTRSKQLDSKATAAAQTWTKLNSDLGVNRLDDATASAFIKAFYGPEVHAVYTSYPLGVMRADFWRYAILYAYGGIYADIDTQCLQPVANWFPPRVSTEEDPEYIAQGSWKAVGGLGYHSLTWNDCSLVVALENNVHMCQWIIAAVPGHPVLKEVVQRMVQRAQAGIDCAMQDMVHAYTGPGVWTEAIRALLGVAQGVDAGGTAKAAWTDPAVYQKARGLGICVMAPTFWGTGRPQNAKNLYGSQHFDPKQFPRWIEERSQLHAAIKDAGKATAGKGGSTAADRQRLRLELCKGASNAAAKSNTSEA